MKQNNQKGLDQTSPSIQRKTVNYFRDEIPNSMGYYYNVRQNNFRNNFHILSDFHDSKVRKFHNHSSISCKLSYVYPKYAKLVLILYFNHTQ